MSRRPFGFPIRLALAGAVFASLAASRAHAQERPQLDSFAKVQAELERQSNVIAAQQREIDQLRAERDDMLAATRAGSAGPVTGGAQLAMLQAVPSAVSEAPPVAPIAGAPVGERPPKSSSASSARPWRPSRRNLAS